MEGGCSADIDHVDVVTRQEFTIIVGRDGYEVSLGGGVPFLCVEFGDADDTDPVWQTSITADMFLEMTPAPMMPTPIGCLFILR